MSIGGASHFRREKPHMLNAERQKKTPERGGGQISGVYEDIMREKT